MYFNIEKIKEELRPIMVILYLQIRHVRKGRNIFILCPDHEKNTGQPDRHIGNCVLKKTFNKAYYCYGCGASGDCFTLIARLTGLNEIKDFRQILEIAAEACGGKELYSSTQNFTSSKKEYSLEEKNLNTLSRGQLELIGLSANNCPFTYVEYFSNNHNTSVDGLVKDADFQDLDELGFPALSYLTQKWLNYSINNLLNSCQDAYLYIVKGKAKEAMENYKNLANKDWKQFAKEFEIANQNNLDFFCEKLKDAYKSKYLEAESIWKTFATESELEELNDSWIFGYDEITEKKPGTIL